MSEVSDGVSPSACQIPAHNACCGPSPSFLLPQRNTNPDYAHQLLLQCLWSLQEKKHRHKDHGKDKDVVKAAKEFLKHQLAPGSTPSTHESRTLRQSDKEPGKTIPEGQRISDEDYFKKSNEFIAWLHESHQILFNELSTAEAHSHFSEFVRRWNQGRLPAKYYAGLVTAPVRRTPHVWGFEKSGAGTSVRAGGTEAFLSDQKAR
eukprot:361313-Chlamydomonas_euryale.AAC.8